MMVTKDFATPDVLSVLTGKLVPAEGHSYPVDAIYAVLNWMSGESLDAHQLPRVGREAKPVLLAAHPQLAAAIDEAKQVNGDNWVEWRRKWIDRYGPTLSVPKLTIAEHERIEPLSELAERISPEKIALVSR